MIYDHMIWIIIGKVSVKKMYSTLYWEFPKTHSEKASKIAGLFATPPASVLLFLME